MREEIGHDSLSKSGILNQPDEIRYNKENLIKSYSIFFPNHNFIERVLWKICFKSSISVAKSFDLFSKCLNNEALFCYFYSKGDIYIDKHVGGLDYKFETIKYLESDSKTKLFTPKSNSEIMPFLNKDKWGFKKNGELIINCIYDYNIKDFFYDIRFGEDGVVPVSQNKLFGYIDTNGKTIIDFQYLTASRFNNGLAIVSKLNNKKGVINVKNDTIIDFKYDEIDCFNDDLYVVKLNEKYGLVNTSNNVILDISFNEISELSCERAGVIKEVEGETNAGYINSKGEIIIKPSYEIAYDFEYDLAVVEKENDFEYVSGLIDKSGVVLVTFDYDEISIHEIDDTNNMILISGLSNDKWGVIYMGGTPLNPALINAFDNVKFIFQNDEEILKEFKNDSNKFDFDYFKSIEGYGFKDSLGEIIIEPIYENVHYIDETICRVSKNNKWGIINNKGELIIDMIYDKIYPLDDYILVKREEKIFYLDEVGNELASF